MGCFLSWQPRSSVAHVLRLLLLPLVVVIGCKLLPHTSSKVSHSWPTREVHPGDPSRNTQHHWVGIVVQPEIVYQHHLHHRPTHRCQGCHAKALNCPIIQSPQSNRIYKQQKVFSRALCARYDDSQKRLLHGPTQPVLHYKEADAHKDSRPAGCRWRLAPEGGDCCRCNSNRCSSKSRSISREEAAA